jgi:hypothetical protein
MDFTVLGREGLGRSNSGYPVNRSGKEWRRAMRPWSPRASGHQGATLPPFSLKCSFKLPLSSHRFKLSRHPPGRPTSSEQSVQGCKSGDNPALSHTVSGCHLSGTESQVLTMVFKRKSAPSPLHTLCPHPLPFCAPASAASSLFWATPNTLLPQGLCTGCASCPELHTTRSLTSCKILSKCCLPSAVLV